jgi:hypothetical protein
MKTTITYTILIILIAVGFAGCDWFSSSPEDGTPKLFWKTKIHTTGGVDGRFPNVIYNNRIFVTMAQ